MIDTNKNGTIEKGEMEKHINGLIDGEAEVDWMKLYQSNQTVEFEKRHYQHLYGKKLEIYFKNPPTQHLFASTKVI